MLMCNLNLIFLLVFLIVDNSIAQYPIIPCPDLFQYVKSADGGYFGMIKLNGYVDYGTTTVEVELSQPGNGFGDPNYSGKLELNIDLRDVRNYIETKTAIPYKVHFKYPNVIPNLTLIRVNGVSICTGPKVNQMPRTNLYLRRSITIQRLTSTENSIRSSTNKDQRGSTFSTAPTPTIQSSTPELIKKSARKTTTTAMPVLKILSPQNTVTLDYINSVCGKENINSTANTLAMKAQLVPRARFPWMVAIFKKGLGALTFQCGASLISTRTVISAAHCFYEGLFLISEQNILVSLGRHELNEWVNSEVVQREVERIIQHPDYRPELMKNDADLAIVRLTQSVTFSHSIRPVCLWNGSTDIEDIVGVSGIVVGWGMDEINNITNTPKFVNATVASDVDCLKSDHEYFFLTTNRTLCAGNLDGSGPCNGDSGGGLMIRKQNKWMLRGVVSIALGNAATPCDLKKYVIYSDTAHFLAWIRSLMLL